MGILIELLLIPVVLFIIKKSNMISMQKKKRVLLNILLFAISLGFVIACFTKNLEPYKFETEYSVEYMIYEGVYILDAGLIFMFSPFMWIIAVHYIKLIYKKLKIRKDCTLRNDDDFIFYRGDLEKISPSIVMFLSKFELNFEKCISSTILKLKLMGYIQEKENKLVCTDKDSSQLIESEKNILDFIRNEKFNKKEYKKMVENECLEYKYITKNGLGILGRIIKIIIALCVPILMFCFSLWLDEYVFENYHVWPERGGQVYIKLKKTNDIENLEKEVKDKDDYMSSILVINGKETISYSYDYIRADKLQYSVVRKALFLHIIGPFLMGFVTLFIFIGLCLTIQNIIHIKNVYRVTIKGKEILNKAYALKNYLKRFSLLEYRTDQENEMWEYYLVYASVLNENVRIENELIIRYAQVFGKK